MRQHQVIIIDRVRRIGGRSFAFVPHRFLSDGFLASLTADERSLYLFLVLAADREGVSFWSYDRICSILGLHLDQYIEIRNNLIDKDLLAFDGTRFQVLELPDRPVAPKPLRSRAEMDEKDPATIASIIHQGLQGGAR